MVTKFMNISMWCGKLTCKLFLICLISALVSAHISITVFEMHKKELYKTFQKQYEQPNNNINYTNISFEEKLINNSDEEIDMMINLLNECEIVCQGAPDVNGCIEQQLSAAVALGVAYNKQIKNIQDKELRDLLTGLYLHCIVLNSDENDNTNYYLTMVCVNDTLDEFIEILTNENKKHGI